MSARVRPEGPEPPVDPPFDRPEVALDPTSDPGAAAFGATGAEASVDVWWPALLRHRVQARAMRSPRYPWWVLTALLAGLLSLNITFTVFVVALPAVAKELHTNYSVLTWTSTGPLLAFGLAAPLFGKWGDLFGHRRLYMFGLVGAMVSALLTALAPNVGVLLFARILDGVQGAATGTASMAIILRLFSPADRVKAMGWWSMVGAGGPVIGVSVGSVVIGALGWRALFWGQLGLLVVSMVVVALVLPAHGRHSLAAVAAGGDGTRAATGGAPVVAPAPAAAAEPVPAPATGGDGAAEEPPNRWGAIDWVGSWSLSATVAGAMLALSIGPLTGWTSPGVLVCAGLALVGLVLFVHRERTAEHPLIPVVYFRRRNFVLPMGARAGANFAYFGAFFLFPLLMEQVYGWQVAAVGLVSIARPIFFSVSAPVAGYVTPRVGERAIATFGTAAVTVSMLLFAGSGSTARLAVLVPALCLAGLGMGVASPSMSSTQANEVDPSEFGVTSAAQLLALQLGEVVGIQVSVTVLESHTRHHGLVGASGAALLPSFRVAFLVGAVVAAGATVCAALIRNLARAEPAAG